MDSGEVGVIGLDARIGRLAKLLGRERMDEADFVAVGREELLRHLMITTGPLDGDNEVAQIVLVAGRLELGTGGIEFRSIMFDRRGWDEDLTVEVTQHPLEAGFGTVDADDAEVFGPN